MAKVLWLLFPALLLLEPRVKTVNMQQLQAMAAQQNNDTLYVVNFWATWCKPCVGEMPYFEKADAAFKPKKVKVVFVSLNSARELPAVEKFVADKSIKPEVVLLSAGNPNAWIDSIDQSWSGAIPATAMYRNGKKVFFREGEFTQSDLDSIIQTKIK
jgi:thiol-disulfide isomerase/thioredoxin